MSGWMPTDVRPRSLSIVLARGVHACFCCHHGLAVMWLVVREAISGSVGPLNRQISFAPQVRALSDYVTNGSE